MSATTERFRGAGPWLDGQFYVWDTKTSGVCNPDSGQCNIPWRKLWTIEDANVAASILNSLEHNYEMQALMYAARVGRSDEDLLI